MNASVIEFLYFAFSKVHGSVFAELGVLGEFQ